MAREEADSSAGRVLVVDDEATVLEMIGFNLRREGYDVAYAATGQEAIKQTATFDPNLVVLDVMLPGMDGLQVCRALRETSTVPILLLSARTDEIDRVVGLEVGADDYLTKPFAMRELIARVRAMMRRARMVEPAASAASPRDESSWESGGARDQLLQAGDIAVDVRRRYAAVGEQQLVLKPKEFDLLAYLVRNPGIVLSREALLREVWGYSEHIDTRTIDVHIRWLRQKIERDPARPERIATVRGHGYRLVPQEAG